MSTVDDTAYEFGPFRLEPRAQLLSRAGETVPLMAKEFEILHLLVSNQGRLLSKEEIMSAVWPDSVVEENNLTVRMSSLRKALGESRGHHPYIQTVSGRGYRLVVRVREVSGNGNGVDNAPAFGSTDPAQSGNGNGRAISAPTGGRYDGPASVDSQTGLAALSARQPKALRGLRLSAILAFTVLATLAVSGAWRYYTSGGARASTQAMRMSRLTQTGRVSAAVLSPDGQYVAYVQHDGEQSSVWFQRAGSGKPVELLPPAKLVYRDLAFSSDGNSLYYLKCQPDCALNKMPVLGGVETNVAGEVQSRVAFSPDGKRMAFVRTRATGFDLVSAKADGSAEEVLNTRSRPDWFPGGAPSWSPDGKLVAYAVGVAEGRRNYAKVIGVRVADHAELTLAGQGWRFIKDVAWLPDGSAFVINARDEASAPELAVQIWQVSYPQGAARRITNDLNNYMSISLSADGKTLLAQQVEWSSSIWSAPAHSPAKAVRLTHGTSDRHDGNLGLAWTPEGGIVYVSDVSGRRDIWSAAADGTQPTQLTDGRHADYFPVVSPDGRYIVFESSSDGAHNIWLMDPGGRNLKRLTSGSYDSEARFTPDGKWVVYVSRDGASPKLCKVPIDGGEPAALTAEFSLHPAVSPDGKLIAYYRRDPKIKETAVVVIIPAGGGPPVNTLPAPENMGPVMQWTPDGGALSYVDNLLANIWIMPLRGAPPSPLTSLQTERMFSFAWSHDGRKLAYASGQLLSDAILISHFN